MDFDAFTFDTSVLTQAENSPQDLSFLKQLLTSPIKPITEAKQQLIKTIDLDLIPLIARYDFEQTVFYESLVMEALSDIEFIYLLSNVTTLNKPYFAIQHRMNPQEFKQLLTILQIPQFLSKDLVALQQVLTLIPCYIVTGELHFSLSLVNHLGNQIPLAPQQLSEFYDMLTANQSHQSNLTQLFKLVIATPSTSLKNIIFLLTKTENAESYLSSQIIDYIQENLNHQSNINPLQKFEMIENSLEHHISLKLDTLRKLVSDLNKASLDDDRLTQAQRNLLSDELKYARQQLKQTETDQIALTAFFQKLATLPMFVKHL
ncbi:hypothetical protein SKB0120_24150 (plasmid) [Moraxella osloensis]